MAGIRKRLLNGHGMCRKRLPKLRTNGLAIRGAPGSTAPDKLCRRCRQATETISHVISACPVHLPEVT
ncbi:hypothetical protein ElyMa_003436400 [Elysia marginata]|uniref:Reverse transcriptase zinc-binding domain-containing protein n=1 Tax=Elysia marginata TaxID=1093978 RepID=A0AAV4JU36_9GAST|nr:hypothetical protein ElyMa_003436400 [Elysia marginata]